ncbi:hypothetical protein A2V82_07490 [candidate division KSB1 bacterium RBG_16_48_16]|nr:MAG: hypothetical protein A2V82_07490 [candidate division KSB1 bacterium RBG_16_48_16]
MDNLEKISLIELESAIKELFTFIGRLKTKNKTFEEENKKLRATVVEKDNRIKGLQKIIEELKAHQEDEQFIPYEETREKLVSHIKNMLSNLEEIRIIE